MYKLYLGFDPDICFIMFDEKVVKRLARRIKHFGNQEDAETYAERNDNSMSGIPYYSCWYKGEVVFVS